MRVEDKWPFQVQQKRHEMKKRRRGRGYLSTRRAIDRAGGRSGAVTAQGHNSRRQGSAVDGEGGNPPPQTVAATQGSCGGRVLRSRRYRRPFEDKPIKRLFTPEIKRFLKGWLVRRRENPYPSREEKKELSRQTALTYVQICNWFANWRRKLKNAAEDGGSPDGSGGIRDIDGETLEDEREDSSGPEDDGAGGEDRSRGGCRRTWGNLIRSYNSRAHGNVEQFSITSDDSIWEEEVEESVDVEEEEEEDYGRRPDPPSSDDGRHSSSEGEEEDNVQGREEGCQDDWPTVEHSYSILLDRPKAGGAVGRQQKLTSSAATVSPGRKPRGDRKGGGVRRRIFGGVRQGGRKGSCEVTSSSSSSSGGSDCEGAHRGGCGGVVVVGGDRRQRAPSSVSKWLESAYAFDERKMNFSSVVDAGGTSVQLKWAARNVTWPSGGDARAVERTSWILSRVGVDAVQDDSCRWSVAGRHKEELDAAEALARLAATASP